MIEVEQGLILSLTFSAFDIHSSGSCNDHLTIMDGDGTTLMEKSCGSSLPANITSITSIVKLMFITNGYGTETGWALNWTALTPGGCLLKIRAQC